MGFYIIFTYSDPLFYNLGMGWKLVGIREAAEFLGVTPSTLRRGGRTKERTAGGYRRYDLARLRPEQFHHLKAERKTGAYALVVSHDQKNDPERQQRAVDLYYARQGRMFELVTDLGSRMSYHRKDLTRLLNDILADQIGQPVVTHKNHLLRNGRKVHILKLGWVRVHKAVRFTGRVAEGTVSRTADRWLLGVAGEMLALPVFTAKTKPGGGGSRHFGTSHLTGWEKNAGPQASATVRKRRRLSKQFSRQMDAAKVRTGLKPGQPISKGMCILWSKTMQKTPRCIARLHARIKHVRADAPTHDRSRLALRCHRHRGCERGRNVEKSHLSRSDRGYGLGRVPAAIRI